MSAGVRRYSLVAVVSLVALLTLVAVVASAAGDGREHREAAVSVEVEVEVEAEVLVDDQLREEDMGLDDNWEESEGWVRGDEPVLVYAEAFGISPDEAFDVLSFQSRITGMADALHSVLGPTLSRLEFVDGKAALIVHVTHLRPGDIEIVTALLGADSGNVEIRLGAAMTYPENDAAQQREESEIDAVTGALLPTG